MVAFMRDNAIEYLHFVLLRFLQQKHFCIEIALVADCMLHVVAGLNGAFAVVYDRCFAQMTQKAIEAFRAVSARKTVYAKWNIKDGEPLAVGPLRHIGLQFFRSHLLAFAADACSCKQIAVFRNETRRVASAQKHEEMQQKNWFYESF